MNSFNFQIVPVANLAAIVTPFPDHICYFTEDTENYYIWKNEALKEIFVDASSITWNNITNKPTTITGYGITDAVKANNGTLNYLAKFTPDGTTIGNSIIRDNGTNISINSSPLSSIQFYISSTLTSGINVTLTGSNTLNIGNGSYVSGGGATNIGYNTQSYGATSANIGGRFRTGLAGDANLPNGYDIAVYGSSEGSSRGNVGGLFIASGGTSNYAVQLQDGTQGQGKFLKSITTDGKANWANINITEVTNGLSSTLLGAPNGIATLDNSSKLLISQMPISVMDYKGTYDIVTNTPNLQDGVGNQGDVYVATTAGTRTFGTGNTLTVSVGDWLIYNGTKWEKTLGNNVGYGTVTSVGLSLGTTGTDVNISNSPITSSGNINLNIPTASSTARGLLSTSDWTTFNSKVGGGGLLNYIPKFTPNGNTLGISKIIDDGDRIGVNTVPNSDTQFNVFASTVSAIAVGGVNQGTGALSIGGHFGASGASSYNIGVKGYSLNSPVKNIGVEAVAQGTSTGETIGVYSRAESSSVSNIAGFFVSSGTGSKYSLQLQDGTQGQGKFLKSVTSDGKANWANITAADITGVVDTTGGTANYISKFTDANTIEESQIFDDGTLVGLGIATPEAKLHITNTTNAPSLLIEDENNPDQTPFIINNYGLVGIGTKNPQAKLHLYLEDNRNFLIVNNPTGVTLLASNDAVNTYRDLHFDSNQFKFKINGTEIATIATNSCIGVGTNLPTASLHIANGSINDSFRVDDEGSDTTYFVIDNDGNVGVGGSANVGRKLNIKSNKAVGIAVSQSSQGTSIDGRSTIAGSSANFGVITFASNSTTQNIGIDSVASGGATSSNIGLRADVSGGLTNYCFQGLDGTQGEGKFLKSVTNDGKANWGYVPKVVQLAVSDETTALTTGTGKITFRMPYGMTLTEVRASLTTAQTSGSIVQVDINEGGTSILSTKITLDNGEKTSVTALTPPVLSDTSLADDSEITVDIDQLGDGTAKGLKITLIGY